MFECIFFRQLRLLGNHIPQIIHGKVLYCFNCVLFTQDFEVFERVIYPVILYPFKISASVHISFAQPRLISTLNCFFLFPTENANSSPLSTLHYLPNQGFTFDRYPHKYGVFLTLISIVSSTINLVLVSHQRTLLYSPSAGFFDQTITSSFLK